MTLSINLAQALNCEANDKPCGQCNSCSRIMAGKHADVQVIGLDGEGDTGDSSSSKEIGIDRIRDMERSIFLKPFEGRHRVYVLDGADRLTSEAANCLLKTLEEPPPCVTLLLLVVDERQVLPTVLSRCQRIELRPVPTEVVKKVLAERQVDVKKADEIARISNGRIGWALQASSNEDMLTRRNENIAELVKLCSGGRSQRFKYAAQLANTYAKDKEMVQDILGLWLSWWRDLLLLKGGSARSMVNVDHIQELEGQAEGLSLNEIKGCIRSIQNTQRQLYQNTNPRLAFEVLMLDMPS